MMDIMIATSPDLPVSDFLAEGWIEGNDHGVRASPGNQLG